jgi:catechol 2,3-dioxygenase-like lactoylglutathione lyase family enzyme
MPPTARVSHLRHVAVAVADFDTHVSFYEGLWGLRKIATDGPWPTSPPTALQSSTSIACAGAETNRVDLLAFGASDRAAVDTLAGQVATEGVHLVTLPSELQTAGGGYGFRFFDPDGRTVEVSCDVSQRPYRVLEARESIPRKLSHVVLNSPDPERSMAFYTERLGFKVSGWLENWFGFLRCTPDFHSLAFVRAPHANLNHLSFELRGYDEYMRGVGRALQGGVPMY